MPRHSRNGSTTLEINESATKPVQPSAVNPHAKTPMMRSVISIGTFIILSLGVTALGINLAIALWQKFSI
jgi:hypothetical protein